MKEARFTANAELRSDGENKISGYAAVFNSLSEDLGGFRERILPGAFRSTLSNKPDVRALINHDPSLVLGRTTAGTLTLTEDSKGLKFTCTLPETTYARNLRVSIARGDISQCSFGFSANEDRWTKDGIRELLDVNLFDVSAVTYPAYPDTSVQARSLEGRGFNRVGVYPGAMRDLEEMWLRIRCARASDNHAEAQRLCSDYMDESYSRFKDACNSEKHDEADRLLRAYIAALEEQMRIEADRQSEADRKAARI